MSKMKVHLERGPSNWRGSDCHMGVVFRVASDEIHDCDPKVLLNADS